jgi:hypothetical protein
MRVRVLKPFKDKYKGVRYKAGVILTVTKERFTEMNSTSKGTLVEEVPEKGRKKKGG